MKNLKKVLALVLVVALMMGFATIAGASDFSDDADIDHSEAVEVMEMIGVINGYPDGSFRPDGNVTRAQMATMVAYIVAGGDDVGNLYAGANTFSDCTTHWARGYIAYANHTGIIAGVGNGRFNPDGNVTGAQAAKMMLCALGYNQDAEQYVGTGWQVHVLADARTAGLLSGLENVSMNDALSRQDAAQLMFNALKATMVQYAYGGIIITGDTNVTISGATAQPILDGNEGVGTYDYHLLREEYFPDLKEVSGAKDEEFNRPSHNWVYGDEEVGPYVDEADIVYTAAMEAEDIEGDLSDCDMGRPTGSGLGVVGWYSGGRITIRAGASVEDVARILAPKTDYGTIMEIYTARDDDGDKYVSFVLLVEPSSGTVNIREFDETNAHGAYELYSVDGHTARLYTSVVNERTDVSNVVFHGDIADDAVVTYYIDLQDNLHLVATTELTGVLTSVGMNGATMVIDDETYYRSSAAGNNEFNPSNREQTFAVDEYGYIVKTVEGANSSLYGMVLSDATYISIDENNHGTSSPAVLMATSDGVVETIPVNDADRPIGTSIEAYLAQYVGKLVQYTANGDEYDLTIVNNSAADANVALIDGFKNGDTALILDSTDARARTAAVSTNTMFVLANYDTTNDTKPNGTVTTYTGYNNVPTYDKGFTNAWAVDTDTTADGIANVVFVYDNASPTVEDTYVYFQGTYSNTVDGVAYDVIIKGEADTLTISRASFNAYGNMLDTGMFSIEMRGSTITSCAPVTTSYGAVQNHGGIMTLYAGIDTDGDGLYEAEGAAIGQPHKIADDAPVYYIDIARSTAVPTSEVEASTLTGDGIVNAGLIYVVEDPVTGEIVAVYMLND